MTALPNGPVPLEHAESLADALAAVWADINEDDTTPTTH